MSEQRRHLEISSRAERDLRRLQRGDRGRVVDALQQLVAVPPPGNLDVKQLAGQAGWMRLRVGDYRVLYRPLSEQEKTRLVLARGALEGSTGFLVARIVNRRELERTIRTLDVPEVD